MPYVINNNCSLIFWSRDYKDAIISRGEDFVEKIEELFADDELRENLAKNGRRLVEERYDWKIIARGIAEVYKQLIDKVG